MANIRPLSPELAETVKTELFEDPSRLQADLDHLREWLSKQPHLIARTDDQFLVTFLRGCKFSLERTKEKLEAYYTMRTALPEFSAKRDPLAPEIQEVLKLGLFLPLGLDEHGRRVILLRVAKYDPSKVKITDMFKTNMMLTDLLIHEDDDLIVRGQAGIIDLEGMTIGHAAQLTPSIVKRAMTVFQEAFPIRPKGINYLNMSPTFETIFNLFKSFMKEKLRRRINIHSDLESLYNTIPKDILPKEYGGNSGTVQEIADRWRMKMEANRDFFLDDEKYRSDESKRPGKPKTYEDLFGIEGSFRQLNVD